MNYRKNKIDTWSERFADSMIAFFFTDSFIVVPIIIVALFIGAYLLGGI